MKANTIRTAVAAALALAGVAARADANIIFVTTTAQKITSSGGCSLQEAIYAANRDESTAVDKLNADGSDHVIATGCVAGGGDDRILLPFHAVFTMTKVVDDGDNAFGPTATPMITSNISIEANGSRLTWAGTQGARAFTIAPGAELTLSAVHIKSFFARGGNGADGGGGGLGAGGAVFVGNAGRLTVTDSTFERNGAIGGDGKPDSGTFDNGGGGGGGIGGNGGDGPLGGGGGGGARGNGGVATRTDDHIDLGGPIVMGYGAGGGGTVKPGANAQLGQGGAKGGARCGGEGGDGNEIAYAGRDGSSAPCPGGGGGGGDSGLFGPFFIPADGGDGGGGSYGGGGGGGGFGLETLGGGSDGGKGGFGGGGGAAGGSGSGGDGGFGDFRLGRRDNAAELHRQS
jgi:hypothetical protein